MHACTVPYASLGSPLTFGNPKRHVGKNNYMKKNTTTIVVDEIYYKKGLQYDKKFKRAPHLLPNVQMFSLKTKELFVLNCVFLKFWFLSGLQSSNGATAAFFGVVDFLKDIKDLHGFQTVLIMQNQNSTFAGQFVWENHNDEHVFGNERLELDWANIFVGRIMRELQLPVLRLNEMSTFFLKQQFSDQMLTVVLIDGGFSNHFGLFRNLVLNLRHMTVSKILFLLNHAEERRTQILTQLFRFCWSNKFLNVVALMMDYQETNVYYSYTNFPEFALETKKLPTSKAIVEEIYAYRLRNLKGYRLSYIIGGSDPRVIVYLDNQGKMVLDGFVGHFLKVFAKKYNCELFEPLPAKIDAFAPAQDLITAVRNGTVDISAGITFPSMPVSGYTYPYEQMNWCVMMPVEPDVPGFEYYIMVFELTAFLITLLTIIIISMVLSVALYCHGYRTDLFAVLLHTDCLRGALGQSFSVALGAPPVVRFIYLQICVLGILLTTSYNSYFTAYVTCAPKEPALKSFDDILASGIKIYAWTPEFNELVARVVEFRPYRPMFFLENSYQVYLKMRDSFNAEYGYIMPTTKWKIINEQQKIFTTPIFKRNEELCFLNNVPMCFPVHENSIFRQPLNQLMLETAQAGLTEHWQKIAFLEMIAAGKLTFADLSRKRSFEAMKIGDLFYVWLGFAFMVILTTLVFFLEICFFNRQRFLNLLRRRLRRPSLSLSVIVIKN